MNKENPAFGSSDSASLGGKARAKSLTAAERSEIGRLASDARWKKGTKAIPRAIKEAPLKIGDIEFECAVLDDDEDLNKATRVISERAFSRAIGAKRGGSHWKRRKDNPGGANLPVFLSANNLRPFISLELAAALSEPIKYLGEGGYANGIDAELIQPILEVWLKARDADKLIESQRPFAKISEILIRGLAATGLRALIDEATGIQDIRAADALAQYLAQYVAKEWRTYMRAFPVNFFKQLCRLKNQPFREDMKLPRYYGHYVNDLVWDRLAPYIKDELRRVNPTENGRRKRRHHQWLTEGIGNPKLLHHLGIIEGIALGFKDGEYDKFYQAVNLALPSYKKQPLFAYAAEKNAL
jgi:hypothetical protein